MYQVTTTEKKLTKTIEEIVYKGLFTSEKKEREELAMKIAKEVLSMTFDNEYKAKEFIYEKAFREPMHREIDIIEDTIYRLKYYVLNRFIDESFNDGRTPLDDFLEVIDECEFSDEKDLQVRLENLVYGSYGYTNYRGSWRYEDYIRSL